MEQSKKLKVVKINNSQKPDEKVIENIEKMLELAKKGELVGIASVFSHSDKTITTGYSGDAYLKPFMYLGALDWLKSRILENEILGEE